MPWKFIGILVILILFVIFIGLNLDNKSDLSLGFYTFSQVPVFLLSIIAFIVGAVVTIPLSIKSYFKKKKKEKDKQKQIKEPEDQEKPKKSAKKK